MKPAAEGPLPFALFCTSQNLLRLQNAIKLQSYKVTKLQKHIMQWDVPSSIIQAP
jgi:hypothetical protein